MEFGAVHHGYVHDPVTIEQAGVNYTPATPTLAGHLAAIDTALGGLGGGNTLNGAYDQGGAGAGRVITVSDGAVNLQDVPAAGGTFLQLDYSGATSPTGTTYGMVVDFETNVNPLFTANSEMNNIRLRMNTTAINAGGIFVTQRGLQVDADGGGLGAFSSLAAGSGTWQGIEILMPRSIDEGGGGTITATGIEISGAGVDSQTGSPTIYGINLTMGVSTNTAIHIERGTVIWDGTTSGTTDIIIGSQQAIPIDIGLNTFESGTVISISYDSAESLTGGIEAFILDLNTNLSLSENDLTGFRLDLAGQSLTSAVTHIIRGWHLETVGALTVNNASANLSWYGHDITMPSATETNGSLTTYGIRVVGNAGATQGTYAGIAIDMGNNADIALNIVQGYAVIDGAMTHACRTITSTNGTADDSDYILLFSTGASDRILNLPAVASNNGRVYYVVKIDSGAGNVDIDPSGAETINGAITYSLTAQYESATITNDGTSWYVI